MSKDAPAAAPDKEAEPAQNGMNPKFRQNGAAGKGEAGKPASPSVGEIQKGMEAISIKQDVAESESKANGVSSEAGDRKEITQDSKVDKKRQKGTCKWFDSKKGFGFILPEGGSQDIFVHQTQIRAEGFRSLCEDEAVEYDLVIDAKTGKPSAKNVTGPGGVFVKGAPRPFQHGYGRGRGRYGRHRGGHYRGGNHQYNHQFQNQRGGHNYNGGRGGYGGRGQGRGGNRDRSGSYNHYQVNGNNQGQQQNIQAYAAYPEYMGGQPGQQQQYYGQQNAQYNAYAQQPAQYGYPGQLHGGHAQHMNAGQGRYPQQYGQGFGLQTSPQVGEGSAQNQPNAMASPQQSGSQNEPKGN